MDTVRPMLVNETASTTAVPRKYITCVNQIAFLNMTNVCIHTCTITTENMLRCLKITADFHLLSVFKLRTAIEHVNFTLLVFCSKN